MSGYCTVHRYKDLADIVNAARASGTHTPEDDMMMHKKAHALVNCFIDSAVSPRVQVRHTNMHTEDPEFPAFLQIILIPQILSSFDPNYTNARKVVR